jgi:RNA polymerase sigma-70 factor (ECF subfamily)
MSAMKEEQIVQLVQNGEREVYRHLVERYQAGVIIFCENVIKDRATAEDIAQTAFIKAYQSISSYSASSARVFLCLRR